jgi:hypothetical protein
MAQIYSYPAGIILVFQASCPSGWTRFTALDDKFVRGASGYGATGGGTHSHGLNPASATLASSGMATGAVRDDVGSPVGDSQEAHTHGYDRGATTSSSDNPLPPYIAVIFCKKD